MSNGRDLAVLALCVIVHAGVSHAQTLSPPTITFQDRTVLIGAEGNIAGTATLADMGPGKMGWVESWGDKADSITWQVNVERSGEYKISSILESSGHNCSIAIYVDTRALHQGCSEEGWRRVEAGAVRLTAGPHSIQVNSDGSSPLIKFFSLEFERPQAQERLEALGKRERVSANWMVDAKYGLMFHWTSQSKPREGPQLSYCDAVGRFDVDRFADTVSQAGAGFVVFTTSHAGFYFPGPNSVIDGILPGRTCPRDLVGDLADALNRRHIRLELYFHPGHDDAPWWQRTHFDQDKSEYFKQWREIIRSIGERYGKKLAGWWFDDGAFTYYPFNPDWEQMTAAARYGNPDRVVAYNSWILPKLSDFYDIFLGENPSWETKYENLGFLPRGGSGQYVGGPQKGLQAEVTVLIDADWGHFKNNEPIERPRYTADELVSRLEDALIRREIPLLDVEVYQDGTISPETLELLRSARKAVGPASSEP